MEAPQSESEMEYYCREVEGPKLANMLEYGKTPILSPERLEEIGYTVAAYPLTLLSASANAIEHQLQQLKKTGVAGTTNIKNGQVGELMSFEKIKDLVGFNEYYDVMDKFGME